MNLKKLILTGTLLLLTSPFAFADEIGSGNPEPSMTTSTQSMQASDEIGSGTPTASDEIGSGSEVQAMLAWWDILMQSF